MDAYPSQLNLVTVLRCSTLFKIRIRGEIACMNKNDRRFYSDNSNSRITSEVLNEVLVNQGVSITQEELNKLLNIKGVTFDLPLNSQTYSALFGLVGRPKTRKRKAGIYIFTHLLTGRKYVGSSNSLSRRLEQYFNPNPVFTKEYGLLLPLIKKEGFSAFKLEVVVMPNPEDMELTSDYYFLFLEQYYLLNSKFNLNTQRVVNFRVNQGVTVYLYDIEGKILYYTANSLNGLKADLGVHHATSTKCIIYKKKKRMGYIFYLFILLISIFFFFFY
uniref:Truncated GIY-YIG endonuclease n=1 Tax=Sclerotinia borealis TaxID=77105 RepID=A0A088CAK4_9HELO|nr:truncated GIY-YIG endonuclease [Sclerotinia borealis]AHX83028.1 truncated GIY-YIG endonuclease [Sclerotinia borealis]